VLVIIREKGGRGNRGRRLDPFVLPKIVGQRRHLSGVRDRLIFNLKKSKLGPKTGEETSQPLNPRNRTLVSGRRELLLSTVMDEVPDPFGKVTDIGGIPVEKVKDLLVLASCNDNIIRYTVSSVSSVQRPDGSVEPSEMVSVESLLMNFLNGTSSLKDHFF